MTADRLALAERRDQALRDLVELEEQVAAGEVATDAAARLRAVYEQDASAAILALESAPAAPRRRPRRPAGARIAYAGALAAALLAAGVFLPVALKSRPAGGFVTGNELGSQPRPTATATRDLSTVTEAELEEVVRANPEVVDMRLALAARYVGKGELTAAMGHYSKVLEREPRNAGALAGTGWVLFQSGETERAAQLVAQARAQDPTLVEAMWFEANLRLYGLEDPQAALETLAEMRAVSGLSAEVVAQVTDLTAEAQAADAGARP